MVFFEFLGVKNIILKSFRVKNFNLKGSKMQFVKGGLVDNFGLA